MFIFACAIETAQSFYIVDALRLQQGSLLRMMIAAHFSWMDLFMSGLGCMTSNLIDPRLFRKWAA